MRIDPKTVGEKQVGPITRSEKRIAPSTDGENSPDPNSGGEKHVDPNAGGEKCPDPSDLGQFHDDPSEFAPQMRPATRIGGDFATLIRIGASLAQRTRIGDRLALIMRTEFSRALAARVHARYGEAAGLSALRSRPQRGSNPRRGHKKRPGAMARASDLYGWGRGIRRGLRRAFAAGPCGPLRAALAKRSRTLLSSAPPTGFESAPGAQKTPGRHGPGVRSLWLGQRDSNPRNGHQKPGSCRWTMPQWGGEARLSVAESPLACD